MEQSDCRGDEGAKSRITNSRRYSASYIRSFREDDVRSRSLKDEIDPSTYSFTTALRALQARSGYNINSWECVAVSLNSKWNEAEKYICNPLSGQFPLECLSAKTLSNRITMSRNPVPVAEKKNVISSGSPSPASTPSILDKRWGMGNGDSTPSFHSKAEDQSKFEVKETGREERSIKRRGKVGCLSMSWMNNKSRGGC